MGLTKAERVGAIIILWKASNMLSNNDGWTTEDIKNMYRGCLPFTFQIQSCNLNNNDTTKQNCTYEPDRCSTTPVQVSDTQHCLDSVEGGKTGSGKTCQRWSEQSPHEHDYAYIGDHNYCRKAGENYTWCYTIDAEKRWEFCEQTICSDTGGRTVSGRTCQNWSEQHPHEHSHGGVGDHNNCKNPSDHTGLCCYTTDPDKRWEDCDETIIVSDLQQAGAECENTNKLGLDYRGTVSVTEQGFHCEPWILSTEYQYLADTLVHPTGSACRSHGKLWKNHDGRINNLWCYYNGVEWGTCDVSDCTHEVGQDDLFKLWINLFYSISLKSIDENQLLQIMMDSRYSHEFKGRLYTS